MSGVYQPLFGEKQNQENVSDALNIMKNVGEKIAPKKNIPIFSPSPLSINNIISNKSQLEGFIDNNKLTMTIVVILIILIVLAYIIYIQQKQMKTLRIVKKKLMK